jgi:hypothetical protein
VVYQDLAEMAGSRGGGGVGVERVVGEFHLASTDHTEEVLWSLRVHPGVDALGSCRVSQDRDKSLEPKVWW